MACNLGVTLSQGGATGKGGTSPRASLVNDSISSSGTPAEVLSVPTTAAQSVHPVRRAASFPADRYGASVANIRAHLAASRWHSCPSRSPPW